MIDSGRAHRNKWGRNKWAGIKLGGMALLVALLVVLLGACATQPEYKFVSVSLNDTRCPADGQMVRAADSDYGRGLIERFSGQMAYPAEAVKDGQAGDVQVCLRIDRDGVIQARRLQQGSGYPALDAAALLTLGKLSTQPAPPKDFGGGKKLVWIALKVHFDPGANGGGTVHHAAEDRPCKLTGSDEGDTGAQRLSKREWGEFPRRFSEAVKGQLIYPVGDTGSTDGATLLCVALDRNGNLLGATIARSSGSAALDGASLEALGKLLHQDETPPLPDAIREGYDNAVFTEEIDWAAARVK